MRFIHGKVADSQKYWNWITGSFYPKDVLNHDNDLEIKVEFLKNNTVGEPHYHPRSKAWTIVLQGAMHLKVAKKQVEVKAGEYIIYEPGVIEELTGTDPDTIVVNIHKPSFPGGDKVEI